ncbi:DUF6531 domain-containing protein [Seonamhaeicola sp. ML3]|uniref:DUF6531 domain-containing protein n=1 Tax=Seonamhaeicola sp. ML3 TaxID=2937786 RepID=UPI00200CF62F|nr:DUF6531 domain-containing protein [Seonamhaeicola sp. ML3]
MIRYFKILVCIGFFLSNLCYAGVNLKNGNYYVSYTDIEMNAFRSAYTSIVRTYNSKSTTVGLWGYGWGSEIETKLYAYPDGTILIQEFGSGATTYYKSDLVTDDMIEIMVDELLDITLSEGDLTDSPDAIIARRNKLMKDMEYRSKQWDKYVEKGLLDYALDFPEGMEWESYQRGNSALVRTSNGYTRTSRREIETFDFNGNLTKYDKGNGVYSILEYVDNRLSKMISADGKELVFTLNDDGFIVSIASSAGNSSYIYEGKKLVETKDAISNIFKHTYDDLYNMTSISYQDGSVFRIEYHPKTYNVKKIVGRDGTVTGYEYHTFYNEDGSINKNHYATSVIKEYYGTTNSNYYEYLIGRKSNGEPYNKMIKTIVNGITTQTHYDELCGNPTAISRNEQKTTFKYNNRCLLIEKLSTLGDSIYLKYHPKFEKITYVKNNDVETEFGYDDRGNLITAKKDDGNQMELVYDSKGQIIKMIQFESILIFEYNDYGKTIKITKQGYGTVNIDYDKNGDMLKVTKKKEKRIMQEVNEAFQNMLTLVKPAGVNLQM